MENTSIYHEIARRTGGNIYLGVVGPVRTGKSTLVKQFMEQMVLPNIADPYRAERARDELPQSASGRTIMTAEPKFVPEEAAALRLDDGVQLQIRLIDSVGYLVDGAAGAEEDGQPRMITTPWADAQIPMAEAAELGTKKVMEEHATVGVIVTTDGSITDIPRENYVQAEQRAIRDMRATGKPFVVVINSVQPEGERAGMLAEEIRREGAACVCLDCLHAGAAELSGLLQGLLMEFPMVQAAFYLPGWVQALDPEQPLRKTLYRAMREAVSGVGSLREAARAVRALESLEEITEVRLRGIDLGTGTVSTQLVLPDVPGDRSAGGDRRRSHGAAGADGGRQARVRSACPGAGIGARHRLRDRHAKSGADGAGTAGALQAGRELRRAPGRQRADDPSAADGSENGDQSHGWK